MGVVYCMITIFDTFTKQNLSFENANKKSLELGLSRKSIYALLKFPHITKVGERYCRADGIQYWKTLIDFETEEEIFCLCAESLCKQIGAVFNKKAFNLFHRLGKKKGNALIQIEGRTFYLKGFYPKQFKQNTKNAGPKLAQKIKESKLTRIIGSRLRNRIYCALKGREKTSKSEDLLGCRFDFFLGWLESQFKDGMNWSNYGKWHIDHIKPCNTFNLTIEEEQKKCFHYTNCRPLWAEDNLRRPCDGSDIVIC